jgi:DNA-binding response OmpR family regulator
MPDSTSKLLIAADGSWVRQQVRNALAGRDLEVLEVSRGEDVRGVVASEHPDLVILDMQIGNMGGIAVAIDLHLEASADRLPDVSTLLLLDREHDRFLAKRAATDAELVKPVDPGTLRRTVMSLLGTRAPA